MLVTFFSYTEAIHAIVYYISDRIQHNWTLFFRKYLVRKKGSKQERHQRKASRHVFIERTGTNQKCY